MDRSEQGEITQLVTGLVLDLSFANAEYASETRFTDALRLVPKQSTTPENYPSHSNSILRNDC